MSPSKIEIEYAHIVAYIFILVKGVSEESEEVLRRVNFYAVFYKKIPKPLDRLPTLLYNIDATILRE